MVIAPTETSLQLLFGRAFLLELQLGNLDLAKLFARAFLLRTRSVMSPAAA